MQRLLLRSGRVFGFGKRFRRWMNFLPQDARGFHIHRFERERFHATLFRGLRRCERDMDDLLEDTTGVFFVEVEDELVERVVRARAGLLDRELEFVSGFGTGDE